MDSSGAGTPTTTPPSPGLLPTGTSKKEKGRVRFNSNAANTPPPLSIREAAGPSSEPPRPRPSVLRGNSYNSVIDFQDHEDPTSEKSRQALAAQERAQQVAARLLGGQLVPGASRNSVDSDAETVNSGGELMPNSVPMDDLAMGSTEDADNENGVSVHKTLSEEHRKIKEEAYDLVRSHIDKQSASAPAATTIPYQSIPTEDRDVEHYVPPPAQYRSSVLANLLKLYKAPDATTGRSDAGHSGYTTPGSSGTATPTRRKWYDQNRSQDTLSNLVEASARLGSLAGANQGTASSLPGSPVDKSTPGRPKRPKYKRSSSSRFMNFGRSRPEEEARITIHIAETLSRQTYIIKLCKALMLFGAPTHRLEEYLRMTARVLEIEGQFLYLPGCMIISFDDRSTHTTEVKIVRTAQGIDLGNLKDVHEIYKEVLHDVISVDEAIFKLNELLRPNDREKWERWVRVAGFGFASAAVAPFAFGGRPIDLPLCFVLGCIVGFFQLILAPRDEMWLNVFEVFAATVTSFLARGLGSIRQDGEEIFCFSAMAQSSIALILPGWLVLCSALELQSKNIVPGSIRMVYAIIYSLFLGFGVTLGTVLYGLADPNATYRTSCVNSPDAYWSFFSVPLFTIFLAYVNKARVTQMPAMVVISFAGYMANFFGSRALRNSSPQIANTLGAFAAGLLASLYSRLRHGVAVAALLPAIFVQVPSGLSSTGSLLSGLNTSKTVSNSTVIVNGTATVQIDSTGSVDNMVFSVAASMIQIAIGLTVGLFMATLCVYLPFSGGSRSKRSALFTL